MLGALVANAINVPNMPNDVPCVCVCVRAPRRCLTAFGGAKLRETCRACVCVRAPRRRHRRLTAFGAAKRR